MLDRPLHDGSEPRQPQHEPRVSPPGGGQADRRPSGAIGPASRPTVLRAFLWRWRFRIPLLVLAAAGLWAWAAPRLLGPVVTVQPVLHGTFVHSIVASGRVEAPFRVNVASQITGVVRDIPVSEGQAVKAGDTLLLLDDREAKATVAQAEGAVAQAEARLRQLDELVRPSAQQALVQAQATQRNAQRAFDRVSDLASKGVSTKAALDEAQKALDIATAQLRAAQFQVATNAPGGSDHVLAQTQLAQARAALLSAQSRLGYTVIRAPRDGVLISRDVERGNVVQPGAVLMRLSPFGPTQLVVQIDERNLSFLAAGQPALASADAYPKETFGARVVFINPGVNLQRASVEVKLRVDEPPAYLRQDMTVSVDIETARRPNAVMVPAEVVRDVATGPWVMTVAAGRAQLQPVKLGLVSGGKAEILEGLTAADQVVPVSASVRPGDKLRARSAAQGNP